MGAAVLGDASIEKASGPLLSSPNRMKLVVFGVNCSGGTSVTSAEERLRVEWEESKRIALAADAAGIEAMVPIARWRGFGGETNYEGRSFETFAWAAGLAAVTERIFLFSTLHVPTAHPIRVAKELATVDHISGGRFGLNLVAGWNAAELSMFGLQQREHDLRYEFADEFVEVLQQLATEDEELDFDGEYFRIEGGISNPKPIQSPFPVLMSAGISGRGSEFAARHADINIVSADGPEQAAELVEKVKTNARENYSREAQVFTQGHIICADSEREVDALAQRYFEQELDRGAAENLLSELTKQGKATHSEERLRRVACGWGALQLRGTAEQVVEQMLAVSDAGLDGLLISWVDYGEGLERFTAEIQPLMVEAGLRAELG